MNTIAKTTHLLIILLLGLLLCAWPTISVSKEDRSNGAEAGHIVAGSGRLLARAQDGTERRLRRRSTIYTGDTIIVGDNAFIQIRFTDGGLTSLRPGTEFRVSEYHFNGEQDGSEQAVFDLVKGGLRTITGAIGKQNKQNYRLNTPVSTIGIRGTHYGVNLCDANCTSPTGETLSDGLYGGVVDGAIVVTNDGGETLIGNDQYFYVSDNQTQPQELLGPPGVVFDPIDTQAQTGQQDGAQTSPDSGTTQVAGDNATGFDATGINTEETANIQLIEVATSVDPGAAPGSTGSGITSSGMDTQSTSPSNTAIGASDVGSGPIEYIENVTVVLDGGLIQGEVSGADIAILNTLDPITGEPITSAVITGDTLTTQGGNITPFTGSITIIGADSTTTGGIITLTGGTTTTSTTITTALGLTPAPLGSATAIAGVPPLFGPEPFAEIVPQKGTTMDEIYLDANGMVAQIIHRESPDCLDCLINSGGAVLQTDGLPAGGFTLIQPGETVYWGRWEGDWYGQDSYGGGIGQGSWHFIYSPDVTAQSELDNLKANGVIASFSQWSPNDGTIPTDENGNLGYFIGVPRFNVDFGKSEIANYQVNVGFSTGRNFYGMQNSIMPVTFTGPGTYIPLDVFCSGCGVSTGTGAATVVFVGTNASHAISSYEMSAGTNDAVGTILFTDDSLP